MILESVQYVQQVKVTSCDITGGITETTQIINKLSSFFIHSHWVIPTLSIEPFGNHEHFLNFRVTKCALHFTLQDILEQVKCLKYRHAYSVNSIFIKVFTFIYFSYYKVSKFHKGIKTVVLGAKLTKLNSIYLKTWMYWTRYRFCKLVIAWTGENDKNIRV